MAEVDFVLSLSSSFPCIRRHDIIVNKTALSASLNKALPSFQTIMPYLVVMHYRRYQGTELGEDFVAFPAFL